MLDSTLHQYAMENTEYVYCHIHVSCVCSTLLGYSVIVISVCRSFKLITCVYHSISQLLLWSSQLCTSTTSEDLLGNSWFEAAVKKLSSSIHTTGSIHIISILYCISTSVTFSIYCIRTLTRFESFTAFVHGQGLRSTVLCSCQTGDFQFQTSDLLYPFSVIK